MVSAKAFVEVEEKREFFLSSEHVRSGQGVFLTYDELEEYLLGVIPKVYIYPQHYVNVRVNWLRARESGRLFPIEGALERLEAECCLDKKKLVKTPSGRELLLLE